MLILPAIDIRGGNCVRLSQGDYSRETIYSVDPIQVAAGFANEGATWIHIVDLDGAKSGSPQNLSIVAAIREMCPNVGIELGGGIRSVDSIKQALGLGVTRVVAGSGLAKSEQFARECFQFGDQVVAGIDTRDGKVAVDGWKRSTELGCLEFARRMVDSGCQRMIWTDIATDGMLQGPNLDGLAELVGQVPIPVIASGGVSSLGDLRAIAATGVEGAIVGRALYEGLFTVTEAIGATG